MQGEGADTPVPSDSERRRGTNDDVTDKRVLGAGMGPPGGGSVCSWAGAGESELGRDKGFRPTSAQCFTFLFFLFLCSNLIQICFFHLFKLGLYTQTKTQHDM